MTYHDPINFYRYASQVTNNRLSVELSHLSWRGTCYILHTLNYIATMYTWLLYILSWYIYTCIIFFHISFHGGKTKWPPHYISVLHLCIIFTNHTGRITSDESLFTYPTGLSWSSYQDFAFQPVFLGDLLVNFDNSTFLNDTYMVCGDDQQCLFDALATRNLMVGENTRRTGLSLEDDAQALGKFYFVLDSSGGVTLLEICTPIQY